MYVCECVFVCVFMRACGAYACVCVVGDGGGGGGGEGRG